MATGDRHDTLLRTSFFRGAKQPYKRRDLTRRLNKCIQMRQHVLDWFERTMDMNYNSDKLDFSMLGKKAFDDILEKICSSNLNFQVQMSPYSAVISLKKSLIKDRLGNIILPSYVSNSLTKNDTDYEALISENSDLKNQIANLTALNGKLAEEVAVANKKMKNISKELEDEKSASAGMSEQLISTKGQVTKLRANGDKVRKEKDTLAFEVDRLKIELLKNDEKKCSSHILTIKNLQDQVSTLEITNKEQLNTLRKAHKSEVKELNRLLNTKDNDISEYKKQLKNITHKKYASTQTQTEKICVETCF